MVVPTIMPEAALWWPRTPPGDESVRARLNSKGWSLGVVGVVRPKILMPAVPMLVPSEREEVLPQILPVVLLAAE